MSLTTHPGATCSTSADYHAQRDSKQYSILSLLSGC